MRRAAAIIAMLSAIAAAPAAQADLFTSTAPEKPLTPPDPNDFGWQVLTADLAGLASTIVVGGLTGSKAALLPYLLAAPTVHLAHEDGAGAAASLVLNVAGPVGLGLLGYWLDSLRCGPDEDGCGSMGLLVGLLIGLGGAWGLDSGLLSHPDRSSTTPTTPTPRIDMSPSFAFSRDGHISLGLTGRF